jgi:hypothetical protein
MSYRATVIPIMIASPEDVREHRSVVRDIIYDWNNIHSVSTKMVLMPVGWETHSSPELSGRAQDLINEQVLKHCDLLVGIFWTRLGTPTGETASGSVEEIERHVAAGKPAMIYFSLEPIAPGYDVGQYSALEEFKRRCSSRGLIVTFDNLADLRTKFTRQLQLTLLRNQYLQGQLYRRR